MKKASQNRAENAAARQQAEILIEALPWIKQATGKTIVIKYGGAAMTDPKLRDAVVSDIVLMKIIGLNPIVVHGGGNDISKVCKVFGLPVEFKKGMRVTDDATMEVVKMVLLGKVNQELMSAFNAHGHLAVGLSGADAGVLHAQQMDPELGRVGYIDHVDTTIIEDLISADYIPVIATVAVGDDGGAYNVNADLAAGQIAAAIGAQKVIFLTDVDGLYEDFADKSSLISSLTASEAEGLDLSKGMIPKINACITALKAGVPRAHILNGTTPHSMLLEVFTDAGVGTMIEPDGDMEAVDFVEYPLTNLAAKLAVNDSNE